MKKKIQKVIFKNLSLKNYLRILQNSYFLLYKIGVLRFNKEYQLHYFVKKLIHKGDYVIDIGANLGYYSILFAKWVGQSGQVYSVEPIPIYNTVFNEKASSYSNITLFPYALGSQEKDIEMVSPTKEDYIRTGLPHVYNEETDGALSDIKFKFKAKMKRPADLFAELTRIDYIKCDVEGYEYIILCEMVDIIAQHKPKIQIEVWDDNRQNILNLLGKLGYTPYFLIDKQLVATETSENKPQGDYIFIHETDKRDVAILA